MSASDKKRIRIVMVDDSEVVRMGLRSLLGAAPSLEVVGEAANVAGAVEVCTRTRPDVVLLDIRLPDGTGFDACRRILKQLPDTRALILTSVADDTLVDEAIRAGVFRLPCWSSTALSAGRSKADPACCRPMSRRG